MFKALNDEQRDIVHDQTENVGNNETINVGYPVGSSPPGSGELTLNVLSKVTINVGPQGNPLTQLIMDTQSITLNVGPGGSMSQIVMNTMSIASQSNSDQGDRQGDDQQRRADGADQLRMNAFAARRGRDRAGRRGGARRGCKAEARSKACRHDSVSTPPARSLTRSRA